MNKSTKISLLIGGIAVILIGVIGITYAFFSTGGIQDTANTFQSGCLNISLTSNSSSINLNNILPITDVEGLAGTSYDFTIENTCNTSTNYQVNLESLNEQANSLGADYIKVALSSDTNDNVISILSNNPSVTPEVEGAYEAYNLYTGTLNADETKTYHLRLWLDYDATVEQAANKVYLSKINVVANPETQVVDTLEAKFSIDNTIVTSILTSNVTSATYCVTENNICTPNTNATITNNNYTIELEESEEEQVVCTRLNGTSKVICSEPLTPVAGNTMTEIIAGYNQSTRSNFNTAYTEETTKQVFTTTDWTNQTTYYFAGNPIDNWVSFAGFYWRIIRVNGDGSTRLIYSGTSTSSTISDTMINKGTDYQFNSLADQNEYVGLKYELGQQHGQSLESDMLKTLNSWFNNNISAYEQNIDNNIGFCSDRNVASGYYWSSTPNELMYYDFVRRFSNPKMLCNANDILKIKIGLITADEVIFAGGKWSNSNTNYYLYNSYGYWTMTPYDYSDSHVALVIMGNGGFLTANSVAGSHGVRPVINLKANTLFTGTGTSANPYVVVN